jgi:molecular chaperone HscB
MPPSFLRQQMEWREALDDADTLADVEALATDVAARREAALAELAITFDQRHETHAAAQQVRALMFIERFADDVDERLEALGQ